MTKRKKIDEWLSLSIRAFNGSTSCVCPSCSSDSIGYCLRQITTDGYGYGLVWCNSCKKGIWISRMKVDKDKGQKPPEVIDYL